MTNWLTLEEATQYLKMNKSTFYDLVHKGNILAHKLVGLGDSTHKSWTNG